MARRRTAGGLTLVLALLLLAPASEAQNGPRNAPGMQAAPAAPPPQLPPYYLERRSAAPKGSMGPNDVAASLRARGFRDIAPVQQRGNTMIIPQATGPSGERVQLVIGPGGAIVGVRVLRPEGR
ncbi:MAG TPA: hypothetical protein VFY21_15045 [Xanthobacteraceae bacterium]|nr:hypothetical protein [Xanthobacteraceae bacterium]